MDLKNIFKTEKILPTENQKKTIVFPNDEVVEAFIRTGIENVFLAGIESSKDKNGDYF